MADLIKVGDNYYLPSTAVKMFPSAYRGYADVTTNANFSINIESKLHTEFTLRNLSPNFTKESYIIDNTNNYYKCCIGGYYFELDLAGWTTAIDNKKLYICIVKKDLINSSDSTLILKSWHKINDKYDDTLDFSFGDGTTNTNVFGGIVFCENAHPEHSETSLPIYYCLDLNSIESNKMVLKTDIIESGKSGTKITGNLVDGAGPFSIAQIYTKDDSIVVANTASGENAIALGTGTKATKENSVALGTGTKATKENSVALGTYNNAPTTDELFAIGNGTSSKTGNIVTVNKNQVTITGNNANGTFVTTGLAKIATNDAVELSTTGKQTLVNGSLKSVESFTVGDEKFTVTAADGNTEVKGNLTVTGTASITGNVDAQNGLDVTNADLTVGGTNFTATTSGNLTATGTITLGETGGTVNLSNSSSTTAIKGDLTVDGTAEITNKLTANNGLDIVGDSLTVAKNKFIVTTDGNLTARGTITLGETGGTVYLSKSGSTTAVKGNLTVASGTNFIVDASGNLTAKGAVTLGETNGTINLSKSGSTTAIKGNLTVAGTAEITDKLTAYSGLNILGKSLLVGTKFTVDMDGHLRTTGTITGNKFVGKTTWSDDWTIVDTKTTERAITEYWATLQGGHTYLISSHNYNYKDTLGEGDKSAPCTAILYLPKIKPYAGQIIVRFFGIESYLTDTSSASFNINGFKAYKITGNYNSDGTYAVYCSKERVLWNSPDIESESLLHGWSYKEIT